jgi:hypothetical protein
MANINSNFSVYNPSAWVASYQANQFPSRPILANSATNVAGNNLAGFVAAHNETVKVTRAVKQTGTPSAYSGTYSADTPDVNENSIVIDKHYYRQFTIDKKDQKFALPDLVQQHMVSRLHNLFDKVNVDAKAELRKAEAAFADNNTDSTILQSTDAIEAGRILKERKYMWQPGMISVVDPTSEADLIGQGLFHQADQRGSRDVQLTGNMGHAFGFDFYVDNIGSTHTVATVTDAVIADGHVIGDTALTIDDGSAGGAALSLTEGDVVTFGSAKGTDDFYTVQSQTATVLTLKEPLRKAVADDATINPVDIASGDTGRENFFYNKGALAIVTAGMSGFDNEPGVSRAIGYDPMNKANYTVSIEGDTSGIKVTLEVLYGIKLFYPDWVVRYIRGNASKA